jgi:hypothetical protein
MADKTAGGPSNRLPWLIRLRKRLQLADDPRLSPRENRVQLGGALSPRDPPSSPLGVTPRQLTPECAGYKR